MAYAMQQRINQEQQVASLKNDRNVCNDGTWRTQVDDDNFAATNRMTYSSNDGTYINHHILYDNMLMLMCYV
jgi:hypothetical protein